MATETSPHGTRDRLIAAMLDALSTRGYHGIGLNELLANAGAPKAALLTAGLASAREDVSNTRAEQLLLTLQDEFYLERAGDGYAFSLPLFQLWWQRWGGGA